MDNNNKRDGRPKNNRVNYEKEGVRYTPSQAPAQRGSQDRRRAPNQPPRPANAQKRKGPASQKPKKNQYAVVVFYLLTLIVAVAVCLMVFFLVFSQYLNKKPASTTSAVSTTAQPTPPATTGTPVTAVDEIITTGMIKTINPTSKKLGLFDFESQKIYTFTSDGATSMQNKYGEAMSFAEFKIGDIIEARYTEIGGTLSGMTISSRAWEHKNVSNVKVNSETKIVSVGNNTYSYNEDMTISLFEGEDYNIAEIDSLSVVTMRGMGDKVWYVEINKGVGFIDFINGQSIKNGNMEIDNSMAFPLNEKGSTDEPVKVQTGSRRLVITGSNIEPFIVTVDITSGQTSIVDLAEVQITAGVLNLEINIAGAEVIIDEKIVRSTEPQILTYGEHTLTVKKDGYVSYESTFNMETATKDIVINLEKEIKMVEITILTVPAGADIYIDNAYIGISPIKTQIEEGVRAITIKKSGYIEKVFYTDNFHTSYTFELQPSVVEQP